MEDSVTEDVAAPAAPRSDVEEEDLLLEDCSASEANDSDDGGWRVNAASVRLFRFKPGVWLEAEFQRSLLADATNYPYAIREDVTTCLMRADPKMFGELPLDGLDSLVAAAEKETKHDNSQQGTELRVEQQENRHPASTEHTNFQHMLFAILALLSPGSETVTGSMSDAVDLIPAMPDQILPRFLWYRMELEKVYGPQLIKESLIDERSGFKPKAAVEDAEESVEPGVEELGQLMLLDSAPPICSLTELDANASEPPRPLTPTLYELNADPNEMDSAGPETVGTDGDTALAGSVSDCGPQEAHVAVSTLSKKKKRKIQLSVQALPSPGTVSAPQFGQPDTPVHREMVPPPVTDRTDPFSVALRDIQFRLSRHGTVGDPRDYFGKGEGLMDKDDPFIDDEEMMAELGLSKEDLEGGDDRSEDEGDSGSDASEADGADGLMYDSSEYRFLVDNDSEPEPEDDDVDGEGQDKAKKGVKTKKKPEAPRVMRQVDFPKPFNLPLVFSPRGWRNARSKIEVPPLAALFFFCLEGVISAKRVLILQRGIYDTAEFVTLDESERSVKLNSVGEDVVRKFLATVFQASFLTFLVPFAPMADLPGYSDIAMPRHSKLFLARHGEGSEVKESFERGFVKCDPDLPNILSEIIHTFVSPYAPPLEDIKRLWWLAISTHTLRVFARKEDAFVRDLENFFIENAQSIDWSEMNSKVNVYTNRSKAVKKPQAGTSQATLSVEKKKTAEDVQDDAEDEQHFTAFDTLAASLVDFAVSFNQKKNILRDALDAGQIALLRVILDSSYTESRGGTSDSPKEPKDQPDALKNKLERALSVTWVSRCLRFFLESGAKHLTVPFKATAYWLEQRFRRFRSMLRVGSIHDRRRPRANLKVKEDKKQSDIKSTLPSTLVKKQMPPLVQNPTGTKNNVKTGLSPPPTNKRKRETVEVTARRMTDGAPTKKRRASSLSHVPSGEVSDPPQQPLKHANKSPRTIVGCLFRYHELSRIFFFLQASPVKLPLRLTLAFHGKPVVANPNDENIMVIPEGQNIKGCIRNIASWDCQDLSLELDGEEHQFASLKAALAFAESKVGAQSTQQSALALDDPDCKAWQAFSVATGAFAAASSEPSSKVVPGALATNALILPSHICLLDYIAMHVWLNCHCGLPPTTLMTNLAFSDGNMALDSSKILQIPTRLMQGILESKSDYLPVADSGRVELDRNRAGQLSFLTTIAHFRSSLVRFGLTLPPRSRRFT